MNKKTTATIVGGLAVGTVAVGVISLSVWSVIPITVWAVSAGTIGNQFLNLERIRTGKLQPTRIINQHFDGENVVPMPRKEAQ